MELIVADFKLKRCNIKIRQTKFEYLEDEFKSNQKFVNLMKNNEKSWIVTFEIDKSYGGYTEERKENKILGAGLHSFLKVYFNETTIATSTKCDNVHCHTTFKINRWKHITQDEPTIFPFETIKSLQ